MYLLQIFISYIIRRSVSPVCWMFLAKMKIMNTQLNLPALFRCVPTSDNLTLVVETFPCKPNSCLWFTGDSRHSDRKIFMWTVNLAAFHSMGRKASYLQVRLLSHWASPILCVLSTEGGTVRIQWVFLWEVTELPLSTSVFLLHIRAQTDKSCYYRRWSW